MPPTLEMITALIQVETRGRAIADVAAHVGAEAMLAFVCDPELGNLIPAPGFPRTVAGGPAWQRLLAACPDQGVHRMELGHPTADRIVAATVVAPDPRAAFVFVGDACDATRIAAAAPILTILSATLQAEQRAEIARGEVAAASEVARRAKTLTASLDRALGDYRRAEQALRESEMELKLRADQAAMAVEVGSVLIARLPTAEKLQRAAAAIVEHLGAAFARIWTYDEDDRVLRLEASAGIYTHTDGAHARVRIGELKIGRIAQSRQPHLTNDLLEDPYLGDREWARREGLVAFAGYPMLVGDRIMGVLALFSKQPLSPTTLTALGAAADRIALGLDRDRADVEREERDRFRELFIGMLGHDLRNPLGAIVTGTEGLLLMMRRLGEESGLPPAGLDRMQKTLTRTLNSSGRMSRMIDQILDFARLRVGGGIPINRTPGDLCEIARAAVEELETAFPGRAIEARYAGGGEGEWDADRLAQVFSNLLGNALAYGDPAEPILVLVRGDADWLAIQVNNTGPSIPPEVLTDLFDPFRRGKHATGKGTKGLGLGLYITRQIVIAHGGTIEARSTDAGTTFKVRLPRSSRP